MAGRASASTKYWENEEPTRVETGSRVLLYFPKAGKLQIAQAYLNDKGNKVQGKTITLDSEDIGLNPESINVIALFLKDAKSISKDK